MQTAIPASNSRKKFIHLILSVLGAFFRKVFVKVNEEKGVPYVQQQKRKKYLSASALYKMIRKKMATIEDPYPNGKPKSKRISLANCLMTGLAIFSLKFPSLLQFERQRKEATSTTSGQSIK